MSKQSKVLLARLANSKNEREQYEKQSQELTESLNREKSNLNIINRGIKGNSISKDILNEIIKPNQTISLQIPSSNKLGNHHNTSHSSNSNSNSVISSPKSSKDIKDVIRQASLIPSNPRISDWCYHGVLYPTATESIKIINKTNINHLHVNNPNDSININDSIIPPLVKNYELYGHVKFLGRGSFGGN